MRSITRLVCLLLVLFSAELLFAAITVAPILQPIEDSAQYDLKNDAAAFTDWIPESKSMSLCGGHYAPSLLGPLNIDDFSTLPIELSANDSQLTLQGQSTLSGSVALKQGNRHLHADKVTIERNPDTHDWEQLVATGHIHYFEPGINIFGNRASYHHQHRDFQINSAAYRLYAKHARGTASQIDIDKEGTVVLKNANYTTCSPLDTTWLINSKEITLHPKEGRATAKNIWLELKKLPVFYFPYFNYPIDNKRHSGFLFPSYGSTTNSGSEIVVPYYWNIAPNYDLSLSARWLSERGLESQTKFRYLTERSEGIFQWHFLPNDRKYGAFRQETLLSPPEPLTPNSPQIIALEDSNNRHAVNYRHTTQWNRAWQANVIFDYVSDDNYFVDLGNDINTASIVDLPQQANIAYYGDNWSHYLNVEEYQVLQPISKPTNDEIYKRQPQWVFQAFYPNQWLNLTLGLNGELVNFAHQPDIFTQEKVTIGQRYHFRPQVSLPLQESWYFITPRIQLDWLNYSLSLGEDILSIHVPQTPSRTIPIYDLDCGLIFERFLNFKGYHFTQTLEPRLYYLYVPYRDQHLYPNFDSGIINFSYSQLFRDNRFSGRDRIGDANQVSLSLTSRLLPSHGGPEWLRASVGQIFYFEERKVSLCEELGGQLACFIDDDPNATSHHSNLIAQIDIHTSPVWSGGLFWEWDSLHQDTEQAAASIQYHPSVQKIINLNYYWQKHDIAQTNTIEGTTGSLHQSEVSIFWPLNLHWQLLSRWHFDLIDNQTIEVLAGLEYNACCIALQVVGSRYRQSTTDFIPEYATGVFAQIVFKGLSALGLNSPDTKLKQKIPGYEPLYNRQRWLTTTKQPLFPPKDIPLY